MLWILKSVSYWAKVKVAQTSVCILHVTFPVVAGHQLIVGRFFLFFLPQDKSTACLLCVSAAAQSLEALVLDNAHNTTRRSNTPNISFD